MPKPSGKRGAPECRFRYLLLALMTEPAAEIRRDIDETTNFIEL